MTKKLMKLCLFSLFLSMLLQSCMRDYGLTDEEKNAEIAKFEMFQKNISKQKMMKSSGSDMSYQKAFRDLFKRYYELNPDNAPDNNNPSIPYPDFSKASQLVISEDSAKTALFPVIKNGNVTTILVASINKDENFLTFYNAENNSYINSVINSFINLNKTVNKFGDRPDEGEETGIQEVIITVPPKTEWPPKRSDECDDLTDYENGGCSGLPPPSDCQPYQNCDNSPPSSGTATAPAKPKPCEVIQKIGKNVKTKNLFGTLKTKSTEIDPATGKYKETGYALTENNGLVTEQQFDGVPGTNEIRLSITNQIDGYIHNHNPGAFSVFSPYDLATLSLLYTTGKIRNTETFVFGVVTASGTQYMITIDDTTAFSKFAAKFIVGNKINSKYVETIDVEYFMSGINVGSNTAGNEAGFLYFLEKFGAGLKVMKGDSTFNNWEQIERSYNDEIMKTPCN